MTRKLKTDGNYISFNGKYVLCYNCISQKDPSSDQPIRCDSRCAKFRIGAKESGNPKLLGKEMEQYAFCGPDKIGIIS